MKKNRKERQEGALERKLNYDTLTPLDKLNILDNRLGKGIGAKKQRVKLLSAIADYRPSKEVSKEEKKTKH